MRMVNRLIEPTSGHIYLDDEDVLALDPVQLRRRIGSVLQQIGLFPHLPIADTVATVPRLLGWKRDRVRARVAELPDLVGLPPAAYQIVRAHVAARVNNHHSITRHRPGK